jgi:excisionase family DNA binding protein
MFHGFSAQKCGEPRASEQLLRPCSCGMVNAGLIKMDPIEQLDNWNGRYMTPHELAPIIGKSVKTVYRLIKAKRLKSIKIGNEHRLNPRRVAEYLKSLES